MASMVAMTWTSACASAESAASRAVVLSVLVVTEAPSRRLTARNASAMTSVTDSRMSVMTSAMPRSADCELRIANCEAPAAREATAAGDFFPIVIRNFKFVIGSFIGRRRGQHSES